ncbi:NAD-dependent epimerase [Candidatus Atelocyanobacterium thalassae]|uniref:UDP-N-acetylglucosamine 4-epimerase n=1 Tax=cyanobacterium endosymbiont of Braarudosphaera bigelowii TaxID=1285375 RepID=A0ABM7U3Z8_9CHRO|nr:NAD-dependent epimerase [Candidatus Atelocyanobacterium thalassa]BDA39424.1 UDP-N-acetylglucosamine 4-epimerase [cyanobacterium endosymbiont of Braarudosphaera bigelowii]
MAKILVTGAAGFIGFHLSQYLLKNDNNIIIGIDNLNSYYEVSLKKARLNQLKTEKNFTFCLVDIANQKHISQIFAEHKFDYVVHLAAQAGVRYSIENPYTYVDSNLTGFINILESCRHGDIKHLVYASSSSVYGANTKIPFSVSDNVDHPLSLYAATKKANELMAYTYSHLYKIPTTGLRFFTVYGPWGRPDMAYFLFTKSILSGQPINVFNQGNMRRDFTYIEDIVEGVTKVIYKVPVNSKANGIELQVPYKIYNIGNNTPVDLKHFIEILEKCLGRQAIKKYLPMQPGDVPITYANIDNLAKDIGFKPSTDLTIGLEKFVSWYREYYK